MTEGKAVANEWLLVGGRRRRWMWILVAVFALVFVVRVAQWIWGGWEWGRIIDLLFPVVMGLFFLMQLRPRTRATDDGLLVRDAFSRERLIPWSEVQEFVAQGGRWATAVTAELVDGRTVKLPGVQPNDLDSVKAARRTSNFRSVGD